MASEALTGPVGIRERINGDAFGDGVFWLERTLRPNDGWVAAMLLVLNLVVVVLSVEQADWVPSPNLVLVLFLAMLTGLALYRLPVWSVFLIPVGLAVGFAVIMWQLSSFSIEGVDVGGSGQVLTRLDLWLDAARSGSINIDRLPFSFALMTSAWLTGFLGSWLFLRYNNFWGVFVLGGIGLLSNLTFLPPNAAFHLGFYLFTALLLVARVQAIRRKHDWERRGVRVDEHLAELSLSDSFAITVAVILVAFLLPMAPKLGVANDAYESMRSPLESMEDDFNRLFAGLPARRPIGFRIWDDVMALQGSINPTTAQVLWVNSPTELYWKARTYSTYNGKGWLSKNTIMAPLGYTPEFSTGTVDQERTDITYTVTPLYASETLFSGDQVLDVDRDVMIETQAPPVLVFDILRIQRGDPVPDYLREVGEVLVKTVEDGGLTVGDQELSRSLPSQFRLDEVRREEGRVLEVVVTEALPPIPEVLSVSSADGKFKIGEPYQVTSAVSSATPARLREASVEYPAWVLDRYTQLPTDLPQRVRDLTADVTVGATTPYDQAKAVERYLRVTYPYNLRVRPPPFDADGVDHFLFTTREGYSEYFASAMAVMLRTVGVPSRMAVGYTAGDQIPEEEIYSVTDSHSHGWVEVYFPSFGWIPFEPTPGETLPTAYQPGVGGQQDFTLTPAELTGLEEGCFDEFGACEEEELPLFPAVDTPSSGLGNRVGNEWPWVLAALAGLVIVAGASRRFWRRFMSVPASPAAAFQRMSKMASMASAGPSEFQTPYQFGYQLEQALPAQKAPVSMIVASYVRNRYGNRTPTASERRMLAVAWSRLRRPMLWAVVRRGF